MTYVRKDLGKRTTLKRGISTAIIAIIIVILVVAAGAAAYYYAASTVTGTTATSIHTSVQTSVQTSTKVSTVVSTVKPTQSPVTITVWETYAPSSTVDSEFGAFNQSLTAFKAAYPYITVDVQTHVYSSSQADFTTASLANQAPDVVRIGNDWTGALVAEG
jgi:arabinogalactan oligomer/maltooligosaccharide transport system substrate-binding protein